MTVDHTAVLARLMAHFDQAIVDNTWRGPLVEAQIAELLGAEWTHGTNWDGWDFTGPAGHKLEIKQSAALQTWGPSSKGTPQFDIKCRMEHSTADGRRVVSAEPVRWADLLVCAWHPISDPSADHRDVNQWQYYVVATAKLPGFGKIGLTNLTTHAGPPVGAAELRAKVELVADGIVRRDGGWPQSIE